MPKPVSLPQATQPWPRPTRNQPVQHVPSPAPPQSDALGTRPAPLPEFFIGLDLGQARDHTAVAILERAQVLGKRNPATWEWTTSTRHAFRYLERLPLGLDYPSIVEHIRDLTAHPELHRATLIVDATGAGRPVIDMLRRANLPCNLVPVTITGGDRESSENGHWRVPKRDLVNGLVVLFQRGDLQISGHLAASQILIDELTSMRVKISLEGHETYGVWREGEHDDLVLAAALACWRGARKLPPRIPDQKALVLRTPI